MSAPRTADDLYAQGNALLQQGKAAEALTLYDESITARPNFMGALFYRGQALVKLGRIEDAIHSLAAVVALKPRALSPYLSLARHLEGKQRYAECVVVCEQALAIEPDHDMALRLQGLSLFKLGLLERAAATFRRLTALYPDSVFAHNMLGCTLLRLRRPEDAAAAFQTTIALNPKFSEAYSNLGMALRMMRALEPAIAAFDQAIVINPAINAIHVNRATCELVLGRFETGWRTFERRIDNNTRFQRRGYPAPTWSGQTPLDGKIILIHAELGLGDTVQFCRYVPILQSTGARVLFAPQAPLVRLMRTLGEGIEKADAPDFAAEVASMAR